LGFDRPQLGIILAMSMEFTSTAKEAIAFVLGQNDLRRHRTDSQRASVRRARNVRPRWGSGK
jgi:hypothetical protein